MRHRTASMKATTHLISSEVFEKSHGREGSAATARIYMKRMHGNRHEIVPHTQERSTTAGCRGAAAGRYDEQPWATGRTNTSRHLQFFLGNKGGSIRHDTWKHGRPFSRPHALCIRGELANAHDSRYPTTCSIDATVSPGGVAAPVIEAVRQRLPCKARVLIDLDCGESSAIGVVTGAKIREGKPQREAHDARPISPVCRTPTPRHRWRTQEIQMGSHSTSVLLVVESARSGPQPRMGVSKSTGEPIGRQGATADGAS